VKDVCLLTGEWGREGVRNFHS